MYEAVFVLQSSQDELFRVWIDEYVHSIFGVTLSVASFIEERTYKTLVFQNYSKFDTRLRYL